MRTTTGLALLAAWVLLPAGAAAAPPQAPAKTAAQNARLVVRSLPDWVALRAPEPRGDAKCVLFTHAGQVARKLIYLSPRGSGIQGLSFYGATIVYASAGAARAALAESESPEWRTCTLSWQEQQLAAQGMHPTPRYGVPNWAQAPPRSHAVAQHMDVRGSGSRFTTSTYELQDRADPRIVYGFSISASDRTIPRSLVKELLALAR
jgi:hypothetical protein